VKWLRFTVRKRGTKKAGDDSTCVETALAIAGVIAFNTSDVGLAVFSCLLTFVGLIGAYAMIRRIFGWPRLRPDDVLTALSLLPL
jgi:hypothetical protein